MMQYLAGLQIYKVEVLGYSVELGINSFNDDPQILGERGNEKKYNCYICTNDLNWITIWNSQSSNEAYTQRNKLKSMK